MKLCMLATIMSPVMISLDELDVSRLISTLKVHKKFTFRYLTNHKKYGIIGYTQKGTRKRKEVHKNE